MARSKTHEIKELHPKDPDTKYFGTEPVFSENNTKWSLGSALTWYGHFYDETERLAKALGEESLHRSKRPYRALRAWLDNRSVEYYEGEEQ